MCNASDLDETFRIYAFWCSKNESAVHLSMKNSSSPLKITKVKKILQTAISHGLLEFFHRQKCILTENLNQIGSVEHIFKS
jgi:hypothetical protein